MPYTTTPVEAPKGLESTNRLWSQCDVDEHHHRLLDATDDLDFLLNKRRLNRDTLSKCQIGLFSPKTYMFPVFDANKKILNMRYYRSSDGRKWGVKGRTTKLLYPWHLLNGAKTIWIVEGEIDAMMAIQHGIPAISTTAGAPATPATFFRFRDVFRDKRFVLCFDNDEAGQKAAAEIGLDIFKDRIDGIVKWPEWCNGGFDFSDWIRANREVEELDQDHVKEFDPAEARETLGRRTKTSHFHRPDDSFDLKTMWPTSGFLRDYVDFAQTLTDAPDQFHCATALTIMGISTRRKVFFWMGSDKIFPNFYSMIVAPSSVFRKSTVIRIGINLLCKFSRDMLMPREFSTESFVSHLSKKPHGLLAYSEIAELLDQFKKGYSEGMMALMTDFYDCPDVYERQTKGRGTETIDKPFLSILGASTVEWLNSNLTHDQAAGGFWPRFLFWSARKRKPTMEIPPAPNMLRYEQLAYTLSNLVMLEGQMKLTNGAEYKLREWVKDRNSGCGGMMGPAFFKYASRMQPYIIKIAMLFELSTTRSLLISLENMQMSIRLCNWLLSNLEYLCTYEFAYSKRHAIENRVLAFIRDFPQGVSLRDLSRRFHVRKRELDEILGTLLLREYIGRQRDADGIERAFPLNVEEAMVV